MSLDQNLFTLIVTPSPLDPNVVDLVDPGGQIHYRKQRVPGPMYKAEVYDFMSESLLVTASAPSTTSKVKTLELCNPTLAVELKFTGTLSFKWSFQWEDHEFEWKREECYLIRKPDPPVLVAITKEPAGRLKSSSVQVLDYNLNRFDINDRKGLEIVILTALLTFHDSNDTYHSPKTSPLSTPTPSASTPILLEPPTPPPRPEPKTGVDRIAELHAMRGEFNEVTVEAEGSVDDYAQYCWNLLQDDAILFVMIKSHTSLEVQKVVQVAEESKRIRHKAGLQDDLNQYVIYDAEAKKGPKRINLDDASKGKKPAAYVPPSSLCIHLSKIPMPELQPLKPSNTQNHKELLSQKNDNSSVSSSRPKSKLFHRGSPSRSYSPPHVRSHQLHPHQPSPSPSQLNNPMIYVAPPPPSNHSHTHSATSSLDPSAPPPPNYSQHPSAQQTASSSSISGLLERFHLH
ncbi:hypothetical protein J3R30DRAFT_3538239 [Lentinula aciculospora]|uniref:Uncharacterized protein n=1 Tax=Lentinula aciculospora TaxID=153920 RepID=A0A9W8ZYM6_9AGAR|nr:hypothetical protein J3R30DRAFT_3538239 [Lentinula aciculospora]